MQNELRLDPVATRLKRENENVSPSVEGNFWSFERGIDRTSETGRRRPLKGAVALAARQTVAAKFHVLEPPLFMVFPHRPGLFDEGVEPAALAIDHGINEVSGVTRGRSDSSDEESAEESEN
jgi:hypothetical protein